ncbi:MAG: BlaI/MecI/CopY family transcriptional regulator [Clostridia bacterium]|nr:BlaI/MecI/CopY family transcriptional regulator [Clostridia bacterium]
MLGSGILKGSTLYDRHLTGFAACGCKERLGWSKTTTYTVIKRLSDRGVVKNENTVVTSLVSKDDVQRAEIDELVEKRFEGSLPAFIAAFAKSKKLSQEDIDEIRRIIDK